MNWIMKTTDGHDGGCEADAWAERTLLSDSGLLVDVKHALHVVVIPGCGGGSGVGQRTAVAQCEIWGGTQGTVGVARMRQTPVACHC